jgi:hypothetical protein
MLLLQLLPGRSACAELEGVGGQTGLLLLVPAAALAVVGRTPATAAAGAALAIASGALTLPGLYGSVMCGVTGRLSLVTLLLLVLLVMAALRWPLASAPGGLFGPAWLLGLLLPAACCSTAVRAAWRVWLLCPEDSLVHCCSSLRVASAAGVTCLLGLVLLLVVVPMPR